MIICFSVFLSRMRLLTAMSITMQLDLPEELAKKARAAGLLDPQRVASLIARELNAGGDRRSFFEIARQIQAQPGEPMTMEEIQKEVNAARAKEHIGEPGH